MTEHLAKAADETIEEFWALGGETRTINGAHLIRNRSAPRVGYCNVVTRLVGNDADQIARTLERAREWIDAPAMRVYVGPSTTTTTEAALLLAGWRLFNTQVELVATGPLPAPVRTPARIRPVEGERDWACLTELFRLDHAEESDQRPERPPRPAEYTAQAVRARRAKSPHVRHWLAWIGGTACGVFSSWPRQHGMTMVEDLFVPPDHRGLGVAAQLLWHGVADARSAGARPVLIRADADDWPKDLYHRLGFAPVAATRYYAPPKEAP